MDTSFRRHYLDKLLNSSRSFMSGRVLDVGGKKKGKRGSFQPPIRQVEEWKYLNIDAATDPDFMCSADSIPAESGSFDTVILCEVIEHLENPLESLKEICRVMKPGGIIILSVPFLYPVHSDPFDFQRWTEYKLSTTLDSIGFQAIQINKMGSILSVIYDLVYVSLTFACRDRRSLRNRVIRKFIMPIFAGVVHFFDHKFSYQADFITTGYFLVARKKN